MPFPKNGQVDPMQQLVDSFRLLLDEALIFAIANDHDLQSSTGYQAAHDILSDLSQSTVFEETAEPNLTGISDLPSEASNDVSTSATAYSASNPGPKSQESISSGTELSSSSLDATGTIPRLTTFSDDDEETKIKILQGLFTELKKIDITSALKKANGDFQAALDLLLNIQFLEATGQREKGIDGFFTPEETASTSKKKQKKRKKKKLNCEIEPDPAEMSSPSPIKNIKYEDEIAFIADRIDMSYNQVSDIFYRKRCSAGATVMDILDQYVSLGITAQDEESKAQAKNLGSKYRNIPEHYLLALIQVTSSVAQFSDDIAGMLSKHFVKNPWTRRLDLSYRLTPLPNDEIEGATSPALGIAKTPELKSPLSPVSPGVGSRDSLGVDLSEAVRRLQVSKEAKRDADSYASQLLRRGASNSLYRQAAVVYRERSHEHAQNSHALTPAAASLLVEQQSTPTSVDLHGVTVHDGVRIARQRVHNWWEGLGEFRTRKAKEQSLTVITGIGRHSASGVSRLRQAVAAALLQDGWKMRIETGRFVITGRR